ncbi:MAG: rhomboid family intramembrane serine protease [Vicinamibacterales bacterium]
MLFPLGDVIVPRTTPVATWLLIALSVGVHLTLATGDPELRRATFLSWGLIPAAFSSGSVFTSMFVHGNLLHLAVNMICLWIFGDNVEDQLGHGRYLFFYLACGAAAALAETWASPDSLLPMVGASGAIAGVMGAYFVMFPRSRVLVLVFLVFFISVIEVPAVFVLAFWFFLQVIGRLGHAAEAASTGGVALWAYAAGFATGALGATLLRRPERAEWAWHDGRDA